MLTVSSGKSLFSSITSFSDPQKKEEMKEENWHGILFNEELRGSDKTEGEEEYRLLIPPDFQTL